VPELCIENAIAFLEYQSAGEGLQVIREVEPDLTVLQADERRITQHVLVNLLKNAIKFTARGEIRWERATRIGRCCSGSRHRDRHPGRTP